jgi:hypothetical protein
MSVNPMDHRPFLTIWRGAYLSTLQRLLLVSHRLGGDLAAHGMRFDTARAQEVAARLERARAPTLGDFFPDGCVAIRRLDDGTTPGTPATRATVADPLGDERHVLDAKPA